MTKQFGHFSALLERYFKPEWLWLKTDKIALSLDALYVWQTKECLFDREMNGSVNEVCFAI